MNNFYITSPIYYVNDVPHIGHAYTTIACDIISRYHKLKNEDVYFLTGTDEHGQKVERAAKNSNLTPKLFTDKMSENFRKLVIQKNKEINLISQKTEENFVERHIIDCVQAIDFIDIKRKICTDIVSGAGLPGIVIAIVLKEKNIKMKMNL